MYEDIFNLSGEILDSLLESDVLPENYKEHKYYKMVIKEIIFQKICDYLHLEDQNKINNVK